MGRRELTRNENVELTYFRLQSGYKMQTENLKIFFRLMCDNMSSSNSPSVTQSLFRDQLSQLFALFWNIPDPYIGIFLPLSNPRVAMDCKLSKSACNTRNITAQPKYTAASNTYEYPGCVNFRTEIHEITFRTIPTSGAKITIRSLPSLFCLT